MQHQPNRKTSSWGPPSHTTPAPVPPPHLRHDERLRHADQGVVDRHVPVGMGAGCPWYHIPNRDYDPKERILKIMHTRRFYQNIVIKHCYCISYIYKCSFTRIDCECDELIVNTATRLAGTCRGRRRPRRRTSCTGRRPQAPCQGRATTNGQGGGAFRRDQCH